MHKTVFAGIAFVLPALGFPAAGHCSTFKTLHQFSGGADGANSTAELVIANHKLYGTTALGGGARNGGTIFSIDIDTGLESVVYSFIGPKDGGNPHAGLLSWRGAFYGVTETGGPYGGGEAFKFDPANAALTPLHGFGDADDASSPQSNLIDYKGELYGASVNGGDEDGGAIFGLDPTTGSEGVAISFDSGRGQFPAGKLLEKNGVLFGVTNFAQGTLYSLDLNTGVFITLYSFVASKLGSAPLAGVIDDGHQLLGTTGYGGRSNQGGHGTIFSINPKTERTRLLHVFAGRENDGEKPASDLLLQNGVVYGTTSEGGRFGKGTVFQLVLATKTETVLHDFTGREDGGHPVAGLIYDHGVFYGTTYDGGYSASVKGALNYGTVFELIP